MGLFSFAIIRNKLEEKIMNITWLILYGLTILGALVLLDKPLESQSLVAELLKILISGYLGYLIRAVEDDESNKL